MQKIVTDWLRPEGKADPHGVEQARALLETSLGMVEQDMVGKTWAVGDTFTMADCAAAPALFYANKLMPLSEGRKTCSGVPPASDAAAVDGPRARGGATLLQDVSRLGMEVRGARSIETRSPCRVEGRGCCRDVGAAAG